MMQLSFFLFLFLSDDATKRNEKKKIELVTILPMNGCKLINKIEWCFNTKETSQQLFNFRFYLLFLPHSHTQNPNKLWQTIHLMTTINLHHFSKIVNSRYFQTKNTKITSINLLSFYFQLKSKVGDWKKNLFSDFTSPLQMGERKSFSVNCKRKCWIEIIFWYFPFFLSFFSLSLSRCDVYSFRRAIAPRNENCTEKYRKWTQNEWAFCSELLLEQMLGPNWISNSIRSDDELCASCVPSYTVAAVALYERNKQVGRSWRLW